MYACTLDYLAPEEEFVPLRPAHQAWLRALLEDGLVLAAGRTPDHRHGVLVTLHTDRARLDADIAAEPYTVAGIGRFSVQEFDPAYVPQPVADLIAARAGRGE